MVRGGGKGGAGWITLPWWGRALYPRLWGLTEGLVGLLFMEMGKRSAGWPVEEGSLSRWGWRVGEELGELSGWWWEMCNTDAYLLTAACQERRSSAPGSHLKSQAVSSGHILGWLQPYGTSVKSSILYEGHGDTHLLLHKLVLVEECSRGAGQVLGVHREEATETEMRTSASQRGLPSQEKAPCEMQQTHWSWPHGHIWNCSAALAQIAAALCLTGKREILNKVVSTFLYWQWDWLLYTVCLRFFHWKERNATLGAILDSTYSQ